MVNLTSWAIVIFVLYSHISCQNLITLGSKKKLTKTKTRCLAIILTQMHPLFHELLVNTQGNLITAAAEFDFIFDFAIYLCSQKYNRKIEHSKSLPKCFFADGNFSRKGVVSYVHTLLRTTLLYTQFAWAELTFQTQTPTAYSHLAL